MTIKDWDYSLNNKGFGGEFLNIHCKVFNEAKGTIKGNLIVLLG